MSEHHSFFSLGLGLPTFNQAGDIIEVHYPQPLYKPCDSLAERIFNLISHQDGQSVYHLTPEQCFQIGAIFEPFSADNAYLAHQAGAQKTPLIFTVLTTDESVQAPSDGFLKLQLISNRLVKPHQINLDGLFGALKNLAWSDQGAIDLSDLPQRQIDARLNGGVLKVFSVDKFPPMTDYVVPSNVRIADTSRVRLGAHVGEGTTVMHEGFINFNAGTHGASMVEGRISAGVMVGNNSDIGGGASIMGTLSGGGKVVVSIGEQCLLGANAGVGFPLGDRCIIEAGLYVTASCKVSLLDKENNEIKIIKALELSKLNDLMFWRNSQTGRIECKTHNSEIELNALLHTNQ